MRTESTLPFVFHNDQYRTQLRQERFRRFDRQRKFAMEVLEPRMLLDATTPLLAAQTAALKDGLAALEGWADTLDTLSLFTQQIPVVNKSVDEAIDIGDVLRTKLAEAIDDLGSTPTPTDILNKLQEAAYLGPGTVTINTATASEVSFNVVFGFDGTVNTYLNIPGNDSAVSLDGAKEADATYNRVTLNTHLDLSFTFGIDLTAGLGPTESFFIRLNDTDGAGPKTGFNAGIDFSGALPTLNANVGILDVTAGGASSSFALTADLGLKLVDPDNSDGLNHVTLAELLGTSLSSLVPFTGPSSGTITGTLAATLPVSASLGAGYSTTATVTVNDTALFDTTLPTFGFSLADATKNLDKFKNMTPRDLVVLLQQLGTTLQTSADVLDPVGGIPFLEDTISSVTDFTQSYLEFSKNFFDVLLSGATGYTAANAPAANFRLTQNAVFKYSDDGITFTTKTLNASDTSTNSSIGDLVTDLNGILGGTGITASNDGGKIRLEKATNFFLRFDATNQGMEELGFEATLATAVFKFDSIQSFITLLQTFMPVGADVAFAPTTNSLTFRLKRDESFDKTVEFHFDDGLDVPLIGELSLTGHLEANFHVGASVDMTLGVDLSPIGGTFALADGTTLASLGVVVDPAIGNDFKVTRVDGSTFFVNVLNDATTIGQLKTLISTASGGNVVLEIIPDNPATSAREDSALRVVQTSGTGPGTLMLTRENNSLVAPGLKIAGVDTLLDDGIKQILGLPLHGDSLDKHFFIKENASVSAAASVSAPTDSIDLFASLGLVEVGIKDGEGSININAGFVLNDPSPDPDGDVTFKELMSSPLRAEVIGTANVVSNGRLTANATIGIEFNGLVGAPVSVVITKLSTDTNATITDLVADIQAALDATPFPGAAPYNVAPFTGHNVGDFITAGHQDSKLTLTGTFGDVTKFRLDIAGGNAAITELHFADEQTSPETLVGSLTLTASGNIHLPIFFTGLEFLGALTGLPADPSIDLAFSVGSPIHFTPTTNIPDLSDLANLADFSSIDFFDLLKQIMIALNDEDLDLLNQPLPLVGQSVNDLLAFTQPLQDALDAFFDKIGELKTLLLEKINGPLVDSGDGTTLIPDAAINGIREYFTGTGLVAALDAAHPGQSIIPKIENAFDAIEAAINSLPDTITDPDVFDLPGKITAAIGAFKDLIAAVSQLSLMGSLDAPLNGQLGSPADFTLDLGTGTPISIFIPVADATAFGFTNGQTATTTLTAANVLPAAAPGKDVTFTLTIEGVTYLLTVAKTATDGNANIDALIVDINAARTTAKRLSDFTTVDISGGTGVTAGKDGPGTKLKFTANTAGNHLAINSIGATGDNLTRADLIADIQSVLNNTPFPAGAPFNAAPFKGLKVGDLVKVTLDGAKVVFSGDFTQLKIGVADLTDPIATALGYANNQLVDQLTGAALTQLKAVKQHVEDMKRLVPGVQQLQDLLFDTLGLRDLITDDFITTLKTDVLSKLQQGIDKLATEAATDINAAARHALQLVHNRLSVLLAPISSVADLAKLDLIALLDTFKDFEQALSDFASELDQDPDPDVLTDAIDFLNESIGKFSASFPGRLHFAFDSAEQRVTFGLDFDLSHTENVPLDFDLQDVFGVGHVPIAGDIPVDVKTGGSFDVTVGAQLKLDFGVDLDETDPLDFFFLFPTTELTLYGLINGEGLSAEISIGGIGASLHDGSIKFQEDIADTPVDDPASIKFSLSNTDGDDGVDDDSDGLVDINEIPQWFDVTFTGALQLETTVALLGVDLAPTLKITVPLDKLFSPDDWTFQVPDLDFSLAKLDLVTIIKAIESFLGFLSNSLESDLVSKLPLVGDDLAAASSPIDDFKNNYVTPIREKLETITESMTAAVIKENIQKVLFDTFGPGLESIGLGGDPFNTGLTPLNILAKKNSQDLVTALADVDVVVNIDEDGDNDTPGDSDDETIVSDADANVTASLHLIGGIEYTAPFDLGFNALKLVSVQAAGGIELGLHFDVETGLKLDKPHGVSLVLNAAGGVPDLAPDAGTGDPEIEAEVTVELTDGSHLDLSLFFLTISATSIENPDAAVDPDSELTGFHGFATIDLSYGAATDVPILKLPDMDVPAVAFSAIVEVDLRVDASVAGNKNLPSMRADFLLDWDFSIDSGGVHVGTPNFDITNFGLDVGGFISGNLKPILQKINQFLEPIRPILDFLELEVPIISQLSQLVGQGPFTFLDGISLLGEGGDTVARVLEILIEIDNFVQLATSVPGNLFIEFGDFDFGDLSTPDDPKSMDAAADAAAPPFANLAAVFSSLAFTDETGAPTSGTAASGFATSANASDGAGGGLNIQFPILTNPASALKILLGQPADLITMDIPRLEASFEFSQLFGPIIPPFPVFAKIGGSFGVFLDLFVGMDTRGITTHNFLNGFYFGDFENGPEGKEVPEAGVFMELTAGAEFNIAFAKAGVEGGIRAEITADWHDEATPGKVYLDEILMNLQRGLDCIFDLHGELSAFLRAYLEIVIPLGFTDITIIDVSFTIVEITLLDFSHTCPPLPPPEPASAIGGGVLKLNIGDRAGQRQPGATDGDETVTIYGEFDRDGDGVLSDTTDKNGDGILSEDELGEEFDNDNIVDVGIVAVVGFGQTRLFGNATNNASLFKNTTAVIRIEGNAGAGDDEIIMDHLHVPVSLTGGAGDDKFTVIETLVKLTSYPVLPTSNRNDTMRGGEGDDEIQGGRGNDSLFGDAGNDIILGNGGGDTIEGGTGDDTIYGGSNDKDEGAKTTGDSGDDDGADNIQGGDGADRLYGHSGNDTIGGGAGADFLGGDVGDDNLAGGADNDTVLGFDGNDIITGAGGDDQLKGESGNDSISAGSGNDYVEGGSGNDTITGEAGNDKIIGGKSDANDADGNDLISGGEGNDIITGDNAVIDAVTLIGGAGNDTIFGNTGNDLIYGQGGDDIAFGDDATPFLPSQSTYSSTNTGAGGSDTVYGNDGSDVLVGGTGSDQVFGGDDLSVDTLLGDNGTITFTGSFITLIESTAFSAGSNDTLQGGAGADVEIGGRGSDLILGNEGADILVGDHGRVTREAPDGSLLLIEAIGTSEGAGDNIQGHDGDDTIVGGIGNDTISGNNQADVIHGDNARLDYDGSGVLIKITSTAVTDFGNDIISGFIGNDTVLGGTGDDDITGFSGDDVLLGDNGDITFQNVSGVAIVKLITSTFADNGGRDTITGGTGADVIVGGSGTGSGTGDVSSGLANDGDSLFGNEDDDIIFGDNAEIERDPAVNKVKWMKSILGNKGGDDTIQGNQGLDIVFGGFGADSIQGNEADDILIGDNGSLYYVNDPSTGESEGDTDINALDLIRSFTDALGGQDSITGNAGADVAMGGNAGDLIYGDAATTAAGDLNDILLGDNGDITLKKLADFPGAGTDAITIRGGTVATIRSTDTATSTGGSDTVTGNAGGDVIVGGVLGDQLFGDRLTPDATSTTADNGDKMLGDNGRLEWLYTGTPGLAIETGLVFDNAIATLDLITTELPISHPGGRDLMFGDNSKDVMFGGEDVDTMYGDDGVLAGLPEGSGAATNNDLMFGDHGRVYPTNSKPNLSGVNSENFFSIDTGNADAGQGDIMFGEEGNDILIGGQGDDRMFGGSGDDDMIGGHNVAGGVDEISPASISATGSNLNDIMDGGSGNDAMAGDNAAIWRRNDDTSARFRTLSDPTLYTTTETTITANVNGTPQSDPDDVVGRKITLYDHDDSTPTPVNRYGSDAMAGGAGRDTMFGELGDDKMQGDGSIVASAVLPVPAAPSFAITVTDTLGGLTNGFFTFNVGEAASDADDYMEGNGGTDLMFGGLGQDDMIGGSSSMFGLTDADHRPDGSDQMFGGAGTPADTARNALGDATQDGNNVITPNTNGHSLDSDFMMGDNADIYRIVNGLASDLFLTFTYDTGTPKIVVRSMQQLDYSLGGADYNGGAYVNGVANADNGAADIIHGESGDDFIYGMVGSDVLFGDGQDDDIIGGYGNDWISGGTGQDGILGDDGLISTSRNGSTETLWGLTVATTQTTISTPGQIQIAIINVTGELKKSVDLVPFSYDSNWVGIDDEYPDNGNKTPFADDMIFGGLGSDFLHGGSGDDAISGAEVLPSAYVPVYNAAGDAIGTKNLGYTPMNALTIVPPANLSENAANQGNMLSFYNEDTDGLHLNNRFRAGEFDLYDEFNALRKILLTATGGLSDTGTGLDFLLNFNEEEGVKRPGGTLNTPGQQAESYPAVNDDGRDAIFGDLGNDWLVGGTGRDDMFGGWGNDLLNADDNQDKSNTNTNNDTPDTQPYYEDRAFGGAGRDVMIGNTGGDRLIDWVGEYNSYLVPYAPFGSASVSRTMQPQLKEYLYDLSEADGADPTRGGDAARNGEPKGELGLIIQKDVAWQDQTGAPADPQAGNIPGGKRDILRTAGFDNGDPSGFFIDSGTWAAKAGRYTVTAAAGGDAVSVFLVDSFVPNYFEILATINAAKPTGGADSNAYVIFDYQSPTNFKFAGINVATNKLEIGERTAAGWTVRTQGSYPGSVKSNTDYNLFISINGTAVTLIVNNSVSLNYTFAPRVDAYGSHGINEGMVGLGTQNGSAEIDDVIVQRVPPATTFTKTENFSSAPTLFSESTPGWSLVSGRFEATGTATTTPIDLTTKQVGSAYLIDLSGTFRTAGEGGFVFDVYSPTDFKYVSVSAGKITLGHRLGNTWFVDAVYNNTAITTGADQTVGVTLKGTTVSVTRLNGTSTQTVLSFIYNAVVTDGGFGLFSRTGLTSFDTVTFKTDDPALGTPAALTAESTQNSGASAITQDQAAAVAAAAVQEWAAVVTPSQQAALASLQFTVVNDLPGDAIALTVGNTILIDGTAAGNGWFVDSTPEESSEFGSTGNASPFSAAFGKMDLLSALVHEVGHALGYEHSDGNAMEATLAPGQRRDLIDWNAGADLMAALGWSSTSTPAFPQFDFSNAKKGGLEPVGEIEWYVEV